MSWLNASNRVFEQSLGITSPWYVEKVAFDAQAKRLDVFLAFSAGATFTCGNCGKDGCKAHDMSGRSWRHLDFFQYQAHLHANVPRVRCAECGVRQAKLDWARPRSSATLLFERLVLTLCSAMPVAVAARIVGEHDTKLWPILRFYVDVARKDADHSGVEAVGVDEKSARRGHDYITLFADLKERRLLYATKGRKAEVFDEFRDDLEAHGGDPDRIGEICMDMSKAYIKGAADVFPDAEVTFDRFHVVKLLNEGIERVRRAEQKDRPDLKRTRWLWLKNQRRLTASEMVRLDELLDLVTDTLQTAKAYELKLDFQELWALPPVAAGRHLDRWCVRAEESGLQPMVGVAKTIRRHRTGILRWQHSRLTNGLLEAMNSLIQAAKVRARGYRTAENFITMAYLVCGKLEFRLPT